MRFLFYEAGKQELYIEAESDVLTALLDIAKIQSTKASNKIEGIYTSDELRKRATYGIGILISEPNL